MENVIDTKTNSKNKKLTDNLILTLFAYYMASIPTGLVIAGLFYPLIGNIAYLLAGILAVIFLVLTFMVQKLNNTARLILITITVILIIGSLFFPFFIPIQNNIILSKMGVTYHHFSITDYIFYVLAVDGTFLIFGSYMLWVLFYDKKTVTLFTDVVPQHSLGWNILSHSH